MSIQKSRVFVVQDPDGKEIIEARQYGELHVILTGKEDTQTAMRKLRRALDNFQPQDFLLPIGKSINMGMAMIVAQRALEIGALEPKNVVLKCLIWRREAYSYTIENITI